MLSSFSTADPTTATQSRGNRHPILVMIPYEIEIGFAINRLIAAFFQAAVRFAGSESDVHFSFMRIENRRSSALPPNFDNLLRFDYRQPNRTEEQRLVNYVAQHRIETLFALDLRVNASCLKAARRAGVQRVISYWGAPMSSIVAWKLPLKRLEVALTRAKPDLFVFESEAMREAAVRGRGISDREPLSCALASTRRSSSRIPN